VAVGIRPEHVVLGHGPQRARALHIERQGELCPVYLDVQGAATPLLAKTQREDIAIGDEVQFALPAEAMHLFRANGLTQPRPEG